MKIFNSPIRGFFVFRDERIKIMLENQIETQKKWFSQMMENGSKTVFGREYGMNCFWNYNEFVSQVPIQSYNSLTPYIQRIIRGEDYVLCNSKVNWVAKSSGTTASKSKYVPVTNDSLKNNNYLAARDSLTFFCKLFPETNIFGGKGIMLGGSVQEMEQEAKVKCGDVSAILMSNMPIIGDFLKAPSREILLGKNWNTKLSLIAENTVSENITSLSGVPSWMLLVLKEVLQFSGKQSITEVWPELEVYFHGGVSFAPYKEEYQHLMGKKDIFYMNMYNASEGFFGFQDQRENDDLLLLADHGIFYEFSTIDEVGNRSQNAIPLEEVVLHQNYAIIITTLAGLWRYEIGDTVRFTSKNPYRFQITGRTTHYINTFGEELIVDNADRAVRKACHETGAVFAEYTAAPVYLKDDRTRACHQWVIEFHHPPRDVNHFIEVLDLSLKELNSDYEAKRSFDLMLKKPLLTIAPGGTFISWLESKNKLGGQHKIPRLQNDRKMIEEVLAIIQRNEK